MLRPLLPYLLVTYLFMLLCPGAWAQTQPAAQAMPYQQNFDVLTPGATVYPAGWQGWALAGSPSGNYNTAPPESDKPLLSGTASSTTNGAYNYNGKMGFLNSGSVDNALVLALNTIGQLNIAFRYDIMTLRNPFDGGSNTRVNEVMLQYRIGNAGNFTNIAGTVYQNNNITQTGSGVTTPQNLVNIMVTLPPDCSNQPLVQLRWANRQITGAGSRPSFAIDNIQASSSGSDTVAPAISMLQPANGEAAAAPTVRPAITFTENIQAGSGNMILHNVSNGTQQVFAIDSAAVTIANNALTLNTSLQPLTSYYITLDSAAVTDLSGNSFGGIDTSGWRFHTGEQVLSFDFNDCTPSGSSQLSGGFRQYSVSGAQLWGCTTFGQNNSNGVQINGFSGGPVENDDWLISPSFNLSGFAVPLLRFASRTAFAGPALQLMVSTNYDGISNPHTASWTLLNGQFPAQGSDAWQLSDSINLAAFKHDSVYIAFVYTSSPSLNAARWMLDDISVFNSTVTPKPTITLSARALDFDYVPVSQTSAPQHFSFWGNNVRDTLRLTASAGFTMARDSAGPYGPFLGYDSSAVAAGPQTVWVRFTPNAADQNFNGSITFRTNGLSSDLVQLKGTSLRSLKVVNWNIEWFGSPAQDPANDSLQQANVTTVLKALNADIFALAEVVDTARFRQVVSQLPGYSYIISDFGSYADNVSDPDYVSAQKLAFVYKTDVIRSIRSYGVLRQGGSDSAYFNWSSGRFPYLMEASARLNGDSARIQFVLLHAKANTGTAADKIEGYFRRLHGNQELKDSLDAQYPYSNILMLGDFNDALDKTITTEMAPDTTTTYINFINDSTHYKPLTLPLSLAGQQSTVSFATVIDNVIASNEMAQAYLPGSAMIFTQAAQLISSYSSTTTDHYPVISRYNLHNLAQLNQIQSFTAVVDTGIVKLNWRTPYETNAARFIVERSRDQRGFNAIDTVAAHGTTTLPNAYQSYDYSPWLGKSYYRIKLVNLDGSVLYSPVQSVNVTVKDLLWRLLWCIIGNHLQIWLDMEKDAGQAQLQLIDLFGRVKYQGPMNLVKGRNFKELDISKIPTGIYFLRVQTKDGIQTKEILVTH
ncbi:T9SS type A sorting domain-containing protein [Chitinophaga agrisoli]|uniref:T9SS type A sorting domain-containing protein n=1 Tax=Chitinophaga agrisoli TaxID=2607653 RepID=A0A5B2VQA2_9BACT|nr:choice-of-anchor J domain-containing protein [Chitinophaga agrisoli]KAA2240586.1 T9SS type A sorting domain-containing protein [Chitinophaga agrisoli]